MFIYGLEIVFFLSSWRLGVMTRVQIQHHGIHPSTWPVLTSSFLSQSWDCSCTTNKTKEVCGLSPRFQAVITSLNFFCFVLHTDTFLLNRSHFNSTPPAPLPAVHNPILNYFLKNIPVPAIPPLSSPSHKHSFLYTHPQTLQHTCFCFCFSIWLVFYS